MLFPFFFCFFSVKQRKRSVLLKAGSSISIKASVGFFFDKYAQSQGIVPNADQAASAIPHDEVSAETAVKTYPLEERKEAIQNSGGKQNWKSKSWMEKYNLIKSNNNVQLPSYLGVTEIEILLKDTLRSSGDLTFLELKQFMKTYEARRLVLACNSAGICAATNEEPQVDYVSRVKFSEWVYQGIKRTLNKRNAVSHHSLRF